MASKNIEGKIIRRLKDVSAADPSSIAIATNELPLHEQEQFLRTLTTLMDKGCPKEKKTNEKMTSESASFLANLKVRLDGLKQERVVVKTDYKDCCFELEADMRGLDEASLFRKFNTLSAIVASLDVLKCLLEFKRGEIVSLLKAGGNSIDELAEKFKVSPNYINRLINFFIFAKKYNALKFTGYSFETILRFKTLIDTEARADVNFESSLMAQVDHVFEGQETRVVTKKTSL